VRTKGSIEGWSEGSGIDGMHAGRNGLIAIILFFHPFHTECLFQFLDFRPLLLHRFPRCLCGHGWCRLRRGASRTACTGSWCGLMIQYDDIPSHDIESRQFLQCILRIKDVFIHHECLAACLRCRAQTDLTNRAELTEQIVQLLGGDLEGERLHVENARDIGRQAGLQRMK